MCQCVSIVLLQIILCASMLTYMQDKRLQDMGDKMRKMEEKMKQIEEFESVNFYDKLEAFNRIHLMEQKLDEFDRRITKLTFNMHKECPRSQEDLAFKGIAINKKTTAKFNNTAFFWPLDAAAVGLFIVLNKFLFP